MAVTKNGSLYWFVSLDKAIAITDESRASGCNVNLSSIDEDEMTPFYGTIEISK